MHGALTFSSLKPLERVRSAPILRVLDLCKFRGKKRKFSCRVPQKGDKGMSLEPHFPLVLRLLHFRVIMHELAPSSSVNSSASLQSQFWKSLKFLKPSVNMSTHLTSELISSPSWPLSEPLPLSMENSWNPCYPPPAAVSWDLKT